MQDQDGDRRTGRSDGRAVLKQADPEGIGGGRIRWHAFERAGAELDPQAAGQGAWGGEQAAPQDGREVGQPARRQGQRRGGPRQAGAAEREVRDRRGPAEQMQPHPRRGGGEEGDGPAPPPAAWQQRQNGGGILARFDVELRAGGGQRRRQAEAEAAPASGGGVPASNVARERKVTLTPGLLALTARRYDAIVRGGLALHDAHPALARSRRRGRPLRRAGRNLLVRLSTRRADMLRLLIDPRMPVPDNLAEQDARTMKIRQNISGGFRCDGGARDFPMVRSVVSTARKHGWDILQTLNGDPQRLIAGLRVV